MSKMTIVGCGVVGSSWALVFARAGFDVSIYDASTTAQEDALAFVRDALKGSASKELAAAETVELAPAMFKRARLSALNSSVNSTNAWILLRHQTQFWPVQPQGYLLLHSPKICPTPIAAW